MRSIGIAIFLISMCTAASAQSIGAVAKAERQRQRALVPAKVIKNDAGRPATTEPQTSPAESKATAQMIERMELDREKAGLLMKLGDVIHDRKAVQDIEQRLGEIQKRSDELKQESAPKTETKTEQKPTEQKQK